MAAQAHDLEQVTEAFNTAREQLGTRQAAARAAQADAQQSRVALAAARQQVRGIARSAYTSQDLGSLQALLTSGSAEDFVQRMAALQTIAGHRNMILRQATAAAHAAERATTAAQQAVTQARATYTAVIAQQTALQAKVNAYQADFNRLSTQEKQAAVTAAETQGPAPGPDRANIGQDRSTPASAPVPAPAPTSVAPPVAPLPAVTSARPPTPAAAPTQPPGPAPDPPPAAAPTQTRAPTRAATTAAASIAAPASSPAARIAVSTALAQLGKPYMWAANGPDAFDCSGLVQFAYAAAGISLPHSSLAQSQMGTPVPRSQLQPGDLVFFYSPVSHVGIYIGNGQLVHAPTAGDVVKTTALDIMGDYSGARRLTG